MKITKLAYRSFIILTVLIVSTVFARASFAQVCTDNSLVTGCPTCTCPQSGKQFFQEVIPDGSIQIKVLLLNSIDVSSFFNPTVTSQKQPSDWFYGPYNTFNPDGSGQCPRGNFDNGLKYLTCRLPNTDTSCAYADGAGTGRIKLNCVNGPFTARITYPQGYYPLSGPPGVSSNFTSASNINICGQINKTVTWNVGYLNSPQNVTCGQVTPTEIRIDWAAVTDATSYEVYRDGNLIGTVTSNSFSNKGLNLNTTYRYRVKAIRDANGERYESLQSNETVCTTGASCNIPSKPVGLTATTISSNSIDIKWQASTGQVDGYNLFRYNEFLNIRETVNGNNLLTSTGYIDADTNKLICGTNYTYFVEAVGCSYKITSDPIVGTTSGCPQNASCNGILGPDKLEITQQAVYSVQSTGDAPLTHEWTTTAGNLSPTNQKNATFVAPNIVPSGGKATLSAKVSNNINPSGFVCTKEVEITPVLGTFKVEMRKVPDCSSTDGANPAKDINIGLYADPSTGFFWYPQDTRTDNNGLATFSPEIPGDQPYIAKLPISRLNSLVLEACPAISSGWNNVSNVWENTQTLTLSNRSVQTPILYVSTLKIPPSFAKWTSVNQGNITVRNSYSTKGLASDYLIKYFGTAFIKGAFEIIDAGNFGPIDLTKYKAYLFKQYDNELNLPQIMDVIANYPDADVKNCTNIESKTYDTSKGVLKFQSNTGSTCVIKLQRNSTFTIPAFSVVYIDGNLEIDRNILNDVTDSSVFVVTGDVTVGKDVTIIDAGLIVGGNLTVEAP